MDKSWIHMHTRGKTQYIHGVKEFINFAIGHMKPGITEMLCPCNRCNNLLYRSPHQVEDHLYANGMIMDYTKWIFHGEEESDDDLEEEESEEEGDEVFEMLHDLQENRFGDDGESQDHVPSEEANSFTKLMSDAEQELYPGCRNFSKLSFMVKLLHLKIINRCTNKFFTALLQLLKEAFPDGNTIPRSYHDAKKIIRELGLGYDKIHVCENNCVLFWEEYEDEQECPKCHTPRYVIGNDKRKKIPQKILRHLPLIPRLQRLFISQKTSLDMRWHKDRRTDDGVLRHPADSKAWKDFDREHESFALDSRNVRLGLSSDGFNPFGNMSTNYSMWPVFLVPYNLPPWKCMKDPFFMMSLLIPGPKAPGKDIDVFLQPLIKELKELWEVGVATYDAESGQIFRLYAALLWTISDLPAYADLSGWSTKGKLACPSCNIDTCNKWLPNGKKTVYLGHRRFLPQSHRWRKSLEFDGMVEKRLKPKLLSGDDVVEQLTRVTQPCFGRELGGERKRKRSQEQLNWTKRSIFFQLPYWRTLKLRHNLDIMHIEKNVCENILETLLDTEGKKKDKYSTRLDMKAMGIRKSLHPVKRDGQIWLPRACYTLSMIEKRGLCEFLNSVKLPDGMASNISRCVNMKDSYFRNEES